MWSKVLGAQKLNTRYGRISQWCSNGNIKTENGASFRGATLQVSPGFNLTYRASFLQIKIQYFKVEFFILEPCAPALLLSTPIIKIL